MNFCKIKGIYFNRILYILVIHLEPRHFLNLKNQKKTALFSSYDAYFWSPLLFLGLSLMTLTFGLLTKRALASFHKSSPSPLLTTPKES